MPRLARLLLLSTTAVLFSGCLYTNVRAPRAYRSATPADVKASPADKTVAGTSCSRSVLFLVAWGDAGYAAAARDALKDAPSATLYDVKADLKVNSYVLGLYTKTCTLLSGKAAAQ